jgi:CPA2 family monovalent cation:H+ antiporter-2
MHETNLLADLAAIMAVAGVITLLFHRLKQPVVLGYILAGLIVGPYTPPYSLVHDLHTVEMLSELGVILLMFGLGLHFSLRKLAAVGATAVIAASLEIALMILAGYSLGRAFGWNAIDSIFLGAILSMSSTTIIIKALQELNLAKAHFAQMVFGILIVEDILAIALLALLPGIAGNSGLPAAAVALTLGKLALFLVTVLVFGILLVPPLLRHVDRYKSNEMLLIVSLALCFGVSLLALRLGYSVALGAFLIGAVVAESRQIGKIETLITPVRDMFAAVFFVAIGMLIDPRAILTYWFPILVITAVVVVGKVLACTIGAFIAGNDRRSSLKTGMSLAQIGEFSFIIAGLGLSLKVTSDFLYPITVAVSALTTLLTPYLIRSTEPMVAAIDRAAPKTFIAFLDTYTTWVAALARPATQAPRVRRLFLRWALQIALNITLLTAILITAAWAGHLETLKTLHLPVWTGGPRTLAWVAGVTLSLPLLVAVLRKLRAVAMAIAELSVPATAAGNFAPVIRSIIATILLSLSAFALLLWALALTSAITPPWPVLIVLLVVGFFLAAFLWRSLIRVHARAQIQLAATLTGPEPVHHDHHETPALLGAQLHALPIDPASPAVGKLIRELQVRTATGASIVAIDRNAVPLINPGPDEELHAGDRIYLLGTAHQLANAAAALGAPGRELVPTLVSLAPAAPH